MELLIPVINDLQTVFHKTGLDKIELPQIVVVGSQVNYIFQRIYCEILVRAYVLVIELRKEFRP